MTLPRAATSTPTPPGFPSGIPLQQETFENWAQMINVPNLWTCVPQNENDVVRVCNWAAGANFQVRARGIMHTWSPLTVTQNMSPSNVVLVDMTQVLNQVISVTPASAGQPSQVKVQAGATMDILMAALENASGGNGAAQGFGFPQIPAPGNITIGGALAINAHGTGVAFPPNDDFNLGYGSLSNNILAFTAVVTDPASSNPNVYVAKTFQRGQGDDKAFLTHAGRAFLLDVTLQVVDNFNLRCQSFMSIPNTTLFKAPTPNNPPPANSVGDFLNRSGRIEIIWFPSFPVLGFPVTSYPWLKVWTVEAQKPASSTAVSSPYNYPFSDTLTPELLKFVQDILAGAASFTPLFTFSMAQFSSAALSGNFGYQNATDLWGPSKNTLLYVKDSTLRVTANGYAVQMKKAQVQQAIADFTTEFQNLLVAFQNNSLYPINSPLEIRVTSLDDPSKVLVPSGMTAQSPVISSLTYDPVAVQNGWDVAVWFDVLTVQPEGDPQQANNFYAQLEDWVQQHFGAGYRTMPEWSKGWAYTAQNGPWTNQPYIQNVRQQFTTGRAADDNWAYEVATLAKYDAGGLFFNPLLSQLFT